MPLPAIRPVDACPIEKEGEVVFQMRDMEGYVEDVLILSPAAFIVASMLDGANDVADIQAFMRQQLRSEPPDEAQILGLVHTLDEKGFLLTPRFEVIRKQVHDAYECSDIRPAYLAGNAYPSDPDELRCYLDSLFQADETPDSCLDQEDHGSEHCGLIVPHIDFQRGGHLYAQGYARLRRSAPPSTFIIFGVAHAAPPVPFILSRRSYNTPLGVVRNDITLTEALASAVDGNPFEFEITHRTEHSIEFQAVMLAHLFGPGISIVPVLCGGIPDLEGSWNSDAVRRFLEKAHELAVSRDGGLGVVASVDLSHVGIRFGDNFDIDDQVIQEVMDKDREHLAHVMKLDAEGWICSVMQDQNQNRICGVAAVYALLRTLDGLATRAELLGHDCASDPAGGIVSFTSIALTR